MNCLNCGDILVGRSDKLYCDSYCKSAFHHKKRKESNELSFFKVIDDQLKLNRRILKRYNAGGYSTVRRLELIEQGFNPKLFTHYWKKKDGQIYWFCYEYGFKNLHKNGKDKYLIVEWQEYMNDQLGLKL